MKSGWLHRLPAGLFAIPVGLFGLSGAWRRAIGFGWDVAADISGALLWSAVAVWSLLLLLYAAKCLRHPQAVVKEYSHPVQGALLALLPMSILLAVINLAAPDSLIGLGLALLALGLQGLIAFRIVALLANGKMATDMITPALYIPTVGGGFVGAMTLAALHYPGWAVLLFGMGLASWAMLEARVLSVLFHGLMPENLRPTIGVELAAPSIGTLTAGILWPGLPGDVLILGLGLAAGPVVAVLVRYRGWSQVPFSTGFWSFSFPLAALAGAVVEVVRRGGWPHLVGGIALTLATLVIAFLSAKTVALLLNGRLLPPPEAARQAS